MSRVLILYGTTDGHTRVVAHAIGETLLRSGIDADIIEAGTVDPSVPLYDGIIVAASVRAGHYQKGVATWVRAHAKEFGARPAAFVSVSLAIRDQANPKAMADLEAIVARFLSDTGWTPTMVKHVAGALLYTRYNLLTRWLMKRIVAKAGGDTDVSKDYVYTDWADLQRFAEEFRRRMAAAA